MDAHDAPEDEKSIIDQSDSIKEEEDEVSVKDEDEEKPSIKDEIKVESVDNLAEQFSVKNEEQVEVGSSRNAQRSGVGGSEDRKRKGRPTKASESGIGRKQRIVKVEQVDVPEDDGSEQ